MEMSLNRISDLLRENGVLSTVYPLSMHDKQQKLLILLESGLNVYLLELSQDGDSRSWRISEEVI
jgi:hypothetical protein